MSKKSHSPEYWSCFLLFFHSCSISRTQSIAVSYVHARSHSNSTPQTTRLWPTLLLGWVSSGLNRKSNRSSERNLCSSKNKQARSNTQKGKTPRRNAFPLGGKTLPELCFSGRVAASGMALLIEMLYFVISAHFSSTLRTRYSGKASGMEVMKRKTL